MGPVVLARDLDPSPAGQCRSRSGAVGRRWRRVEAFGVPTRDGPGSCDGGEAAEDGDFVVGPVSRLSVGWVGGVGVPPCGQLSSDPGEQPETSVWMAAEAGW